jgi:hypothetical protein
VFTSGTNPLGALASSGKPAWGNAASATISASHFAPRPERSSRVLSVDEDAKANLNQIDE